MGIPVHAISESECVDYILDRARRGEGGWVVTPNLDHLRRLVREKEFRDLCAQATLCVPDGMPLVWASRLRGTPLPERVAGSNLIVSLSAAAAREEISIYLLGGDPGTAEGAARVLTDRFPTLRIAGTCCPEYGFESDSDRVATIRNDLMESRPGILYVALGSPKQEQIIEKLRHDLPSTWCLGVGISFSFLTGDVRRAPQWMQRVGLEWLHRLTQERARLARRYLLQGFPFAARLLVKSAMERISRHPAS